MVASRLVDAVLKAVARTEQRVAEIGCTIGTLEDVVAKRLLQLQSEMEALCRTVVDREEAELNTWSSPG